MTAATNDWGGGGSDVPPMCTRTLFRNFARTRTHGNCHTHTSSTLARSLMMDMD